MWFDSLSTWAMNPSTSSEAVVITSVIF
jgi:hypothetical protein